MQLSETIKLYPTKYQLGLMTETILVVNKQGGY